MSEPRIAIVAGTNDQARDLANGLGLPNAHKVSSRSRSAARGITASAILVDDSAYPIPGELWDSLQCCLAATGGSIYHIGHIDGVVRD